jgi:hypothetical protein
MARKVSKSKEIVRPLRERDKFPGTPSEDVIAIPNPPNSPWCGWDWLCIDFDAGVKLGSWVGAWDDRRKRWLLGQVVNLKLSFEIIDMTTGRRVELSSERSPYYGAVVGANRGVESFKKEMRRRDKTRAA